MKLVRFRRDDIESWGRLDGQLVERVDGSPFEEGFLSRPCREVLDLATVRLLAPVHPSKIVGIGRNYAAHARELGHEPPASPLMFLKAPSSVLGPGGVVRLPPESRRVDFEGELALVVGRRVRRLPRARWREALLGWTVACDVTARDLQKADVQFARAKSFDTFCPLGPAISCELDLEAGGIETRVGGEVRQRGRFTDFLFPPDELIEAVSAAMTLEPGDLVLTGTPEGVGPLAAGDEVEIEIDQVGVLAFSVQEEVS